jgi:hypothetical protein
MKEKESKLWLRTAYGRLSVLSLATASVGSRHCRRGEATRAPAAEDEGRRQCETEDVRLAMICVCEYVPRIVNASSRLWLSCTGCCAADPEVVIDLCGGCER